MVNLDRADNTEEVIIKGFKYFKRKRRLGKKCPEIDAIIDKLLCLYFGAGHNEVHFDQMKKSFVDRYIRNETSVEGVNYLTKHGREELIGLWQMYEYIHSDDVEYMFDIFTIKDLHTKLYSCSRHPEFGGNFRREPAYLHGSSTDVCNWEDIFRSLRGLDDDVSLIRLCAPDVKARKSPKLLLDYINHCVELNCKMTKIHPFRDGNGRTIRGFTNKLFEDAGLPPVYVNVAERDEYLAAMDRAMGDGDYSLIQRFYKYKICDSIYELDIAERLRKMDEAGDMRDAPKNKTLDESFIK